MIAAGKVNGSKVSEASALGIRKCNKVSKAALPY